MMEASDTESTDGPASLVIDDSQSSAAATRHSSILPDYASTDSNQELIVPSDLIRGDTDVPESLIDDSQSSFAESRISTILPDNPSTDSTQELIVPSDLIRADTDVPESLIDDSQSSFAESRISTILPDNPSTDSTQELLMPRKSIRKRKISIGVCSADSQDIKCVRFVKQDGDDLDGDADLRRSSLKSKIVNIYAEDTGPKWHNVSPCFVTPPIVSSRLEKAFEKLPIYGALENQDGMKKFEDLKLREFMGSALNDEEFDKVSAYCSPDALKTGKEIVIQSTVPIPGLLSQEIETQLLHPSNDDSEKLCIVKRHEMRSEESTAYYTNRLKYRGIRVLPQTLENESSEIIPEGPLEPGKDLLFRIRIYRPFQYNFRCNNRRHCVFSRDVVVAGRQRLWQLRDRLVCPNDLDLRVDVSHSPDDPPTASPKELFPSGFMFINNAFYVDTRKGCADRSAGVRAWGATRGMGRYPVRDMALTLESVPVKLGHPDVYVHQGNCEHVFIFSEIRLLGPRDSLRLSHYPCHTSISQNQTVYCTTCAEFAAKWLVTGSVTVPFDPAFFCDTCFRLYMYNNGKKIGEFKAYSYMGNDINYLKAHV